jgi:hypothetical protein
MGVLVGGNSKNVKKSKQNQLDKADSLSASHRFRAIARNSTMRLPNPAQSISNPAVRAVLR